MKIMLRFISVCFIGLMSSPLQSQNLPDSVLHDATLAGCVQYALTHQPVLQQSLIDERITEKQIQTRLADWYPQLGFNYNFQYNFQLPSAYFAGSVIKSGTTNSSNIGLGLTQNIFNKDLLLANRTAGDVRLQVRENTRFNKIDLTVNVSKAFYDVLLTQQQISVLDEAITRLIKSLKDAVNQYKSGVVDKTDYKRATITLNNTRAERKQSADILVAKITYLKQLMGMPNTMPLQLVYDTTNIERDAFVDTSLSVQYQNRIEFQQLQTQQRLQQASIRYYKTGYLPVVSAFGAYNLGYLNNQFSNIYSQTFANSNIGIQLAVPIFQGNKRIYQLRQAELQYKRIDWDILSLKNRVSTEYAQAIALYKGNLANYQALKENVLLAGDVYKTLDLQYKSGIITYLDVIVAEADLRTAQLNYYNALFQLVQSKIDVQKALGTIQY